MLTLREQQIQVFYEAALQRLQERVLAHLYCLFPDQVEALGEPEVRLRIRHAITSAGEYGITSEQGVCLFVDFSFAFGEGFDRRLEWAHSILVDRRMQMENERLARLRVEAGQHDDEVVARPRRMNT